eukprot:11175181-Alexandrium_andersonii.AAC.1
MFEILGRRRCDIRARPHRSTGRTSRGPFPDARSFVQHVVLALSQLCQRPCRLAGNVAKRYPRALSL